MNLFHYTNISALACILSSKRFRLSSLDMLDDLEEKETHDISNIGQFCFVSSWTEDEEESIPMWKMYSSLDAGIRIRMVEAPFSLHDNSQENADEVPILKYKDSDGRLLPTIVPVKEMKEMGFFTINGINEGILERVEYTNEKAKLYPTISVDGPKDINLDFGKLGKYKNEGWRFQSEWRYILYAIPINWKQPPEEIVRECNQCVSLIKRGNGFNPLKSIEIPMNNDAYKSMEITMSPKLSDGNRLILQSLKEKYNPGLSIFESSYKNKLA